MAGTGCAIRRFDAETNTVHWWGIGHFSARVSVPENGIQGLAVSNEVVGVELRVGDEAGFALGWNRWQRLWVTAPDAAFRLYGPSSRLIELNAAGWTPVDEAEEPSNAEAHDAKQEGER